MKIMKKAQVFDIGLVIVAIATFFSMFYFAMVGTVDMGKIAREAFVMANMKSELEKNVFLVEKGVELFVVEKQICSVLSRLAKICKTIHCSVDIGKTANKLDMFLGKSYAAAPYETKSKISFLTWEHGKFAIVIEKKWINVTGYGKADFQKYFNIMNEFVNIVDTAKNVAPNCKTAICILEKIQEIVDLKYFAVAAEKNAIVVTPRKKLFCGSYFAKPRIVMII